MALLSAGEELDRAKDIPPFSNSTEGHSWMSIWCEECAREPDCPLLLVAFSNKTPAAWQDREPRSLNRYTCHEFVQTEEDQ